MAAPWMRRKQGMSQGTPTFLTRGMPADPVVDIHPDRGPREGAILYGPTGMGHPLASQTRSAMRRVAVPLLLAYAW